MTKHQAERLARWIDEHPPNKAAILPVRHGYIIIADSVVYDRTTGQTYLDRSEPITSRRDARDWLGY